MHALRDPQATAKQLFFAGLDCLQAEQFAHAEAAFLEALCEAPDRPSIIANLCLALIAQEKFQAALTWVQRAVELEGDNAQAWLNLAICQSQTNKDPVPALEQCLNLAPDCLPAWQLLHQSVPQTADSPPRLRCAENLCRLAPQDASHWLLLADCQSDLGQPQLAIKAYDQALSLEPHNHAAWHNKGLALMDLNAFDAAIACFDESIRLSTNKAEAWLHRGQALHYAQRLDEAIASYHHVQRITPEHAGAQFNESLACLLKADLKQGWRHFEARWAAHYMRDLPHQQWPRLNTLEALAGKRILVWHEQGFGDSLQFCRYLPLLCQRGAQLTFEVQQALLGVMQSLAPQLRLIGSTEAARQALQGEHFDAQIPLLSLPALMQTELATIPPPIALRHSPAHQAKWAERLPRGPKPLIGIACSGNPLNAINDMKSVPLSHFAGMAQWADVYLIQTELSAADQTSLRQLPITWLGPHIDDFQDSLAIVDQMDLIISIDSSLAHLAGNVHKPLWVLLSHTPDWRWFLAREDSPWYPGARLFRQSTAGDWGPLFTALNNALQEWISAQRG